jgi:anti-anti-sigma factor
MNTKRDIQDSDLAYSLREEMGGSMPIDIWYDGDIFVFRPFGRIDAGHSVDLDAALTEGIAQGMLFIVIDLTDVSYISSSGLRSVIKAAKSVRDDGGNVSVCAMNPHVQEIFRLSGLLRIFPNFSSAKEAVDYLQKRTEKNG